MRAPVTSNSDAAIGGTTGLPQYLADQLTLFQPWGADSAHALLVAPPIIFTVLDH